MLTPNNANLMVTQQKCLTFSSNTNAYSRCRYTRNSIYFECDCYFSLLLFSPIFSLLFLCILSALFMSVDNVDPKQLDAFTLEIQYGWNISINHNKVSWRIYLNLQISFTHSLTYQNILLTISLSLSFCRSVCWFIAGGRNVYCVRCAVRHRFGDRA